MSSVSVLILAGQRPDVVDPLCEAGGVKTKSELPILGRPMMDYVLEALDHSELTPPYYVSGLASMDDKRLNLAQSGSGPADSALSAIEGNIPFPVLITTCDHPLLTPDMISHFIEGAQTNGTDLCVGLAEKHIIQPAYPNVKRTYLNFSDTSVSGCNLFYLANENALEAIRFWRQAQHDRKRPLRLASRVGWSTLFAYMFKRLTLQGAFDHVAKMLGITAKPVLIPIPEAAIDVDKPSDKDLVEEILRRRS